MVGSREPNVAGGIQRTRLTRVHHPMRRVESRVSLMGRARSRFWPHDSEYRVLGTHPRGGTGANPVHGSLPFSKDILRDQEWRTVSRDGPMLDQVFGNEAKSRNPLLLRVKPRFLVSGWVLGGLSLVVVRQELAYGLMRQLEGNCIRWYPTIRPSSPW